MPSGFTFEDAKGILVNRIGVPESAVTGPEQTFDDLGLDSLAFVEIQLAIQQEYDFTIPDEAVAEITSIGAGVEYVNRRLQEMEG